MPEIVNCPQCDRKLRVPNELVGQAVKCPTCGNTFTASMSAPEPPPAPARAAPPPLPAAPEPELLQRRYEETAPAPFSDQGGYADSDYGDDRRGRRMSLRSSARAAVSGPATALLVVGILDLIVNVIGVFVRMAEVGGGGGGRNQQNAYLAGNVIGIIIRIGYQVVIMVGASKMKQLDSYGFAMAASIMAVIPCCSPCLLIGIPFGIWAIVVLNDPQVRDAFT